MTVQSAIADGSRPEEPTGCLDEQAVLDFAAGLLPAQRLSEVERHLSGCDHCAELVMLAAAPRVEMAITRSAPTATSRSRAAPALLQPNTALNETYRIVRFIGEGGMGEVYEVSHARLAGRYAAKVLSCDLATNAQAFSRFRREAQIASGLSHRNIVQVIDFSELQDGRPFLVMEFLDGHDLGHILSKGPLPLDRTMRLVDQVVSALSELHGHRIVHRDLKPQNIFVLPGKDGDLEHVKLVDFGLAKRASTSIVVTRERSLLGTPQYMAPEQAAGKTDVLGPEADQFALAALVYEMLSGRPAFGGDALSTVLYRIVHEMPEPLSQLVPNLPASVYTAQERALAKAPGARYPSIKAYFHALQSTLSVDSAARPGDEGAAHPRRWLERWLVGALVAIVVLAAASGTMFLRTWARGPLKPPGVAAARYAGVNRELTTVSPQDRSTASGNGSATERPTSDERRLERPADVTPNVGAPPRSGKHLRREQRRRASPGTTDSATPEPPATQPAPSPRPPTTQEEVPLIETL